MNVAARLCEQTNMPIQSHSIMTYLPRLIPRRHGFDVGDYPYDPVHPAYQTFFPARAKPPNPSTNLGKPRG